MAMNRVIEPVLHPVKLTELRPTQMTVGLREVMFKRDDWRDHLDRDGPDFLGRHMIPVVIGPRHVPWLIDHHHLARALIDEAVEHVLVTVVARLDRLDKTSFLTYMANRNWLHPYDAKGELRDYRDIPHKIAKLADDPYRSLAGAVRRAGGYAKSETPYSEFLWADYLRRKISIKLITRDFDKAIIKALAVAHGPEPSYLPGYCGVS